MSHSLESLRIMETFENSSLFLSGGRTLAQMLTVITQTVSGKTKNVTTLLFFTNNTDRLKQVEMKACVLKENLRKQDMEP